MNESAQQVATEPSEIEKDANFFKILQGSLPLLKKTLFPILLLIIILSFIGAPPSCLSFDRCFLATECN